MFIIANFLIYVKQRTAQLFENALEGDGQISMNVQTTITL